MNSPKIGILYGTETFNSFEYCVLLSNKLRELNYSPFISSMDSFEIPLIMEYDIIIFISSTFGNGENPSNTRSFWKFLLQKRLPLGTFLDHLYFSTFGLGDSSYPKYQYFIRKLNARILQLGGRPLCNRGEADEQSIEGMDVFYKQWEQELITSIQEKFPLTNDTTIDSQLESCKKPVFGVKIRSTVLKKSTDDILDVSLSRSVNGLLVGEIISNERITDDQYSQDVRNIQIKSVEEISYEPGDIVSLYPSNNARDVQLILESQGWDAIADYKLDINLENEICKVELDGGLVKPLTLRSLLTNHLDIMSLPRRSFFMKIYKFATDEREKEKLTEFSELDNTEELYNYVNRPRRLILEVITEFFSLRIPVEFVLDVFPILRPRMFSIASSQKVSKNCFDLCIAIVRYKTIIKRIRTGVCTNWVKDLKQKDKIVFSISKNNIYTKKLGNSRPLILVGPGTGVAPIRSVIQERTMSNDEAVGSSIYLFTGNRYEEKDYLYGYYFRKLASEGIISNYPSFSRDSSNAGIKYVQDRIYLMKAAIYDLLIDKNAVFYLCGSSGRMPIQVRITLITILEEIGGIDKEEAENILIQIEKSDRYLQETW